jgi:hypothetical protein
LVEAARLLLLLLLLLSAALIWRRPNSCGLIWIVCQGLSADRAAVVAIQPLGDARLAKGMAAG